MIKTIKDFTIIELKAMAYDQLIIIEQAQVNIKLINTEIAERTKSEQAVSTEIPKKK